MGEAKGDAPYWSQGQNALAQESFPIRHFAAVCCDYPSFAGIRGSRLKICTPAHIPSGNEVSGRDHRKP